MKRAVCLLLFAAGSASAAGTDDLERCASIAAPDARLACYDAHAHRSAGPVPASQKAGVSAPPAPSASASTAPSAAVSAQNPQNFGFSLAQQHMAFAGPKSIDARITAIGSSPHGQTYIVLDSGQKWVITENDGWLSKGDAITIKRASLGAYILTASSNHSYYVRRIQ